MRNGVKAISGIRLDLDSMGGVENMKALVWELEQGGWTTSCQSWTSSGSSFQIYNNWDGLTGSSLENQCEFDVTISHKLS